MSSNNDSISKTLIVVIGLCLVCSLIVSVAAVGLKPTQQYNKALDKQRNILEAAGLLAQAGGDIAGVYNQYIEAKVVDLTTGEYVTDIDANKFDQRKASKTPGENIELKGSEDIAGIKRMSKYANVYFAKNDAGEVETLILPVHGYGLWSTMYAFLAVEPDTNTVKALVYYDQLETPGLGGEIENPSWKAQWVGKKLFDDNWNLVMKVVKGGATPGDIHGVDGLSGATLTGNGVQNTFDFWLSDKAFGNYLAKVRSEGLNNG
ncbi:Na(+)-translocating NADH-quinone reductase subunit C [Echinimonas agarilytica]|uniref:Na(+)-translocating NADH-quinone reductase subunit C n=1 Tax=Echinimonas agarilytica TaxID=1215918 RepID=A0AA41W830_9GAMM|nr:Na(+)-translocating NADH-quinone reductase subunit C [Echinimonas agarilytica]MCM2680566.1 Na(+)-translocating NADH-quinone reductase subunit C [Echinimonas agarilytica]